MSRLAPISPVLSARAEPGTLPRGYVAVDVDFAAQLRTDHTRQLRVELGPDEQVSRDVPNVGESELEDLGEDGLARAGSVVRPGKILIGKATTIGGGPLTPEEKLLRAIFGETAESRRDTSLRAPPGCHGVVVEARKSADEPVSAGVEIRWERPLDVGDVLLVDDEPVMVAEIRALGADLAWSGGAAQVAVAKAAMARDVLHARSIGPYSPTTQQPTAGREEFGGQPLLREQVERLAVHAPWALWELLTIKADAVTARSLAYEALVRGESPDVAPRRAAPESETGGGGDDMFAFFGKPKAPPGEEPAVQPEAVALLVAYLHALALRPELGEPAVGLAIATAAQIVARSSGAVGPDDLHSQKIFGPIKDYACECGKYGRMKDRGVVCEDCGVAVIQSRVRRERFGHAPLAHRCRHPLFVGEVATLLERTEEEVREASAAALWDELAQLDLIALAAGAGPRAELAAGLVRGDRPATALMLAVLPVLPPGLRDEGERGLSILYREVLARDAAGEPEELQRAVDHLLLGEDGVRSIARRIGEVVGKRMFEKTVDYSGVAHLVVDPSLAPGECRIPEAMLRELFRPHACGILEVHGYATTIKSSRRMLDRGEREALAAVEEASEDHPVLLMAGSQIVCRRVRGWDAPAVAVDAQTAEGLKSRMVTVHVPLMHEAVLQCEQLADFPKYSRIRPEGWLCRARRGSWLGPAARPAALSGERDALIDPVVKLALGRPPEPVDADERERLAGRARERRDSVWARQRAATPVEEAPEFSVLERRLEELELSVRTAVALERAGLQTIGDICRLRESDLLRLPDFGRKSLKEIKEYLGDLGVSLASESQPDE